MPDLKDSVLEMETLRKNLKKAIENTEDVKNGDATPEEEQHEPQYILYNAIIESVIDILTSDAARNAFTTLAPKLGPDSTKSLIEILSICMAKSAHHALLLYDDLLKQELTRQFDHYGDVLNKSIAVVNSHDGALKVLRKTIGELKNDITDLKDKD